MDDVAKGPALPEPTQVIGDDGIAAREKFLGPSRGVRRAMYVREPMEWESRGPCGGRVRVRILVPDIERGTPKPSLGERHVQRLLIDDLSPRDVDQNRASLHEGELFGADQAACFGGQGAGDH